SHAHADSEGAGAPQQPAPRVSQAITGATPPAVAAGPKQKGRGKQKARQDAEAALPPQSSTRSQGASEQTTGTTSLVAAAGTKQNETEKQKSPQGAEAVLPPQNY